MAPLEDRAIRRDPAAAVVLIFAGALGIAQWWLPWFRDGDATQQGATVFSHVKAALGLTGSAQDAVGAYSVVVVVAGAVAAILFGCVLLARIDHRPPGVAALIIGIVAAACAVYWVVWHGGAGSIGDLFGAATIGWYLFLASGLVTTIGAIKALVSST